MAAVSFRHFLVKERRLYRVRFPILKCTKHRLIVLLLPETPYSSLFVGNELILHAGDIHPHPGPRPGSTEPLTLASIDIPKQLKSQVKVAHLNVRSLKSREHVCLVNDSLIMNNFDIFTLSETWGDESVGDPSLEIIGYPLLRQDRGSKKAGGGSCIYLKNCLKALELYFRQNSTSEFNIQV